MLNFSDFVATQLVYHYNTWRQVDQQLNIFHDKKNFPSTSILLTNCIEQLSYTQYHVTVYVCMLSADTATQYSPYSLVHHLLGGLWNILGYV